MRCRFLSIHRTREQRTCLQTKAQGRDDHALSGLVRRVGVRNAKPRDCVQCTVLATELIRNDREVFK